MIATGNVARVNIGDGYPSLITVAAVQLDVNQPGSVAPTNYPDALTLAKSDGTLCPLPVLPPKIEGWTFRGYFTAKENGTKVIDEDGRPVASIGGAKELYAQWDVIPALPAYPVAMVYTNTQTQVHVLAATVTNALEHQTTVGTWYFHKSHEDEWQDYLQNRLIQLSPGVTNAVSDTGIGDNPSGEYIFKFQVVTQRDGNGLMQTNDSNEVRLMYIRRIPPVYDAAAKTLWANGSALLLRRDLPRNASRVVCYYDQEWDGVYEASLPRGTDLSAEGFWVNGGFQDGDQIGGGVSIAFESGEIYGLDAGSNIAEDVQVRQLTLGGDAVIGAGGTNGFWQVRFED